MVTCVHLKKSKCGAHHCAYELEGMCGLLSGKLNLIPSKETKPGICIRCGKKFDNPTPEIKNSKGNTEIACVGWCAACNKVGMVCYISPR